MIFFLKTGCITWRRFCEGGSCGKGKMAIFLFLSDSRPGCCLLQISQNLRWFHSRVTAVSSSRGVSWSITVRRNSTSSRKCSLIFKAKWPYGKLGGGWKLRDKEAVKFMHSALNTNNNLQCESISHLWWLVGLSIQNYFTGSYMVIMCPFSLICHAYVLELVLLLVHPGPGRTR